jgi:predicted lipoprotein with Yx(FWY)xxD motif
MAVGTAGRARAAWLALVPLALGVAGLTSCGGQGLVGGPNGTVPSASSSTVAVRSIKGLGRILVTSAGITLYLLTSDPPGGSNCTGSCAIVWPPLAAKGRLRAGPGANPALLSTYARSDGVRQVLYAKHALYTYQDDTSPGMVTGQGVETYGGIWWVVAPSGKPVTNGAGPAGAPTA